MPYVIINPELFPREYLGFVDPDDHYSYKGIPQDDGTLRLYNSLDELVEHVHQRRYAMRYYKIQNLSVIIQNYLYLLEEAPHTLFTRLDLENYQFIKPEYKRSLIRDVDTASRIALSLSRQAFTGFFKAGSGGWVTKNEANSRARVCYNCPNNVKVAKSLITKANNKLAALFTPLRKTDYDKDLYDCGICGCPNVQKVHYAEELIREATPKDIRADAFPASFIGKHDQKRYECWVRKILTRQENG